MPRRFVLLLFVALIIQVLQAEVTQTCQPGSFYNVTSDSCQFCPQGTYSNTTEAIGSCLSCPAGSITKKGTTGNVECTICPAGTYEINSTACNPCPERTYSNVTGASGIGSCNACPAGTMAKSGQTGLTNCTICPLGTYESNRNACNYCPARTYSNVTGASGIESCVPCPSGTMTKPGYVGFAACTVCQPGTYEVDRQACNYCPGRTYSNVTGASGIESCLPCPSGTMTKPNYVGFTECTVCQAGTYEADHQTCKYCPAGTYSNVTGVSGLGACIPCPAGYTTKSGWIGLTECSPCPIGQYETNRLTCNYCPARTYSNVTGASGIDSCKPCPPGTMTKPGWSGYDQCIVCQPGTYETDRQACNSCPAGTYSNVAGGSGLESCKACPAGYISKSGQTECTPCAAGYYETDRKTCNSCPAGTYSNVIGGSRLESCQTCPAGYITKTGYTGQTECIPCAAGYYEIDHKTCKSCPSGTYSNTVGASGLSACQTCPPGSKLDIVNNQGVCTPCPAGTYEMSSKCYTCNPGTITSGQGSTTCTPCGSGWITEYGKPNDKCVQCSPGSYEKDHTICVPCYRGTFSSQPGSGSSSCTNCPGGWITQKYAGGNTECVQCPAGTASNDEATGCYNCAPGFHTETAGQSECTKCPPGTVTLSFGGPNAVCKPCPANTYEENRYQCFSCFPGTHSVEGSTSCISNYTPDSLSETIQQNLAQVNITNARDFLMGVGYSLFVEDQLESLQSMAEIPEKLEKTFDAWGQVDWRNGSSITSAVKMTAETGVDLYDHLPKQLQNELEIYATTVAPWLVISYKAGAFIYNFGDKVKDVTIHVKDLHTAFEQKDYYKAGEAIGDLINDAIELKDMKEELKENTT